MEKEDSIWLRCWCCFECGRGRTQNYDVGSKKVALAWSANWTAKVYK